MKLYIFNGYYAVMAETKEEAKGKLQPHLRSGHHWYLGKFAEAPYEQGHLVVKEFEFDDGVAYLSNDGKHSSQIDKAGANQASKVPP